MSSATGNRSAHESVAALGAMLSGRTGSGAHSTFGGRNGSRSALRLWRWATKIGKSGAQQIRQDPVLKLLAGQKVMEQPLAGKSTLNRLELGTGSADRYKKITFWKQGMDELLVDVFVEAHTAAPEEIVLDIDTTDVALHGDKEGRFFHGYYDHYCYLPLYIFSGERLLCTRLRCANINTQAGSLGKIRRIVEQIHRRWGQVHITLRGDSVFATTADGLV